MIMQGCVISCGTVVFFQKSHNLSRSLLSNNNFYCAMFNELVLVSQEITDDSKIIALKSRSSSILHTDRVIIMNSEYFITLKYTDF